MVSVESALESLVRFVSLILPSVSAPEKRLSYKEQATWTTVAVLVFMVLGGLRLPGAQYPPRSPFYIYESAVGARRGSLLELGLAPLVVAHAATLALVAWRVIDSGNKNLVTSTKRVIAFIISLVFGGLLVASGHYGESVFGPTVGGALAFVLPVFASCTLALFDEALAQGYGFGNGINLFIALSVTEAVFAGSMSPISVETPTGAKTYGAFLAPLAAAFSATSKLHGIVDALFRADLPNLLNLVGVAVALVSVVYYQAFRVEIPIKSLRMRGQAGQYPVKILDHYFFPLVTLIALGSSGYFTLYTSSRLLEKLTVMLALESLNIADWLVTYSPDGRIVGGIGYLLAPPRSFSVFAPVSLALYSLLVLMVVATVSVFGVEHSASSSKEVARQLKEQQLTIQGFRDVTLVSVLDRYIPPAARAGGLVMGCAVAASDALGALGSGAGVVLSVMVVFGLVEIAIKDQAKIAALMSA